MRTEKQRHYLESLGRKEFQIYFQPKISGKSQKIASAEVLIRWKRADGELWFPDSFLPDFWKKQEKSRLWITMFRGLVPVACKQKKRRTETAAAVFKCLSGSFPSLWMTSALAILL